MNNQDKLSSNYKEMIGDAIEVYIIETGEEYDIVKEAMLYALNNGGKRIRPILTLEFCKIGGGNISSALPFACAIEMIHCYSLIHDDLPCMDDDDMRRGKPSCHKKYGEAIALLAGDALLTLAFEVMATATANPLIPPERCIAGIKALATYAGVDGMVGGQTLDLINEGKQINETTLNTTHMKKTGSMIRSACVLGAIAAGADKETIAKCERFGQCFGLAFQIIDDVLDVSGSQSILGKPNGSDIENEKTTYVTLYGVESAKRIAKETQNRAIDILKEMPNSEYLQIMIKGILDRGQ